MAQDILFRTFQDWKEGKLSVPYKLSSCGFLSILPLVLNAEFLKNGGGSGGRREIYEYNVIAVKKKPCQLIF